MRVLILALLACAAWGQPTTVSSHAENDVQDTSFHQRMVVSPNCTTTNKCFAVYKVGGTVADCTLSSTQFRTPDDPIPGSDGITTTDHVEYIISGLTKNTTYSVGLCTGSTLLTNSPWNVTTSNSASVHPVVPAAPTATTWTGVTPTSWDSTPIASDGTCAQLSTDMTTAAGRGAGNHEITVPSGSALGNCSITTPTHASGTVYIVPTNVARMPPDQARASLALDAQHMFTMRPSNNPCFNFNTQGWRVIGMDCRPSSTSSVHTNHLIVLGTSVSNIFLDRSIVSSNLCTGCGIQTRAVSLGTSSNVGVVNSYVQYSGDTGTETAGIVGDFADTVLIQNSEITGAGVAAVFAADNAGTTVNTNWLVKRSYIHGDDRQRKGSATNTPSGQWYNIRQGIELKRCVKCKFIGNVIDNWWADELVGAAVAAFLVSPRMINTAVETVADLEVAYSFMPHVAGAFHVSGIDDSAGREPWPLKRLWFHDNVVAHLDAAFHASGCYPGGTGGCSDARGLFFRVGGGADVKFDHNTLYQTTPGSGAGSRMIDFQDPPCSDCTYDDNVLPYEDNALGGCRNSMLAWPDGSAPSDCKDRFTELWPRHSMKNNVIRVKSPSTTAAISPTMTTGNSFPGDDATGLTATGFANGSTTSTSSRDFRLNEFTSAYRSAGKDGRAPGANWIRVMEEIGGVQGFAVTAIATTTISVTFKAYGGLTTPGTACYVDANTSATFANAPTRQVATVNSAIPSQQSATVTGLTTGTNYYIRVHCGGEPFVYGGESAPTAVRTL